MRRPKGLGEDTTVLEIAANTLAGITFGLLIILAGRTIAAGDDNLVDLTSD